MSLVERLSGSGRFGLRFLCAAWLAGSGELLRAWAVSSWPSERPVVALVAAFGASAVLGAWLLWRTRESGRRELVETSAALGFWAGVWALVV